MLTINRSKFKISKYILIDHHIIIQFAYHCNYTIIIITLYIIKKKNKINI